LTPSQTATIRANSAVLWAYAFHDGRAEPLDDADAHAADPRDGGWTWTHLPLSDQRARSFIEQFEPLPEPARALILAAEPRVQIQYAGDWAFGVLPDVQWGLDPGMQDAGRLQFAFCDRWLITARRHALRSVDELRRKVAAGLELDCPAEAWIELIERYVELNEVRLHELSESIDRIEARLLGEDVDPDGLAVGPVRRELSRRRREVSALRTALGRASAPRSGQRLAMLGELLPSLVHEVEDYDREAASLQERARLLHEEIDTRLAGDANRSMRALTVFSTLLIPPTLIVGAFGMNLGGLPFEHNPHGFAEASLLCVVTVGAACALLRRWRIL